MTYGEYALILIRRILVILLILSIIGMGAVSVIKAKQAMNRTDAYIEYLDAKYGW